MKETPEDSQREKKTHNTTTKNLSKQVTAGSDSREAKDSLFFFFGGWEGGAILEMQRSQMLN